MLNYVMLISVDDSIEESRWIKKGDILIEAFDYMGNFWPLYPGAQYLVDLELQQLDFEEPELRIEKSNRAEQIGETIRKMIEKTIKASSQKANGVNAQAALNKKMRALQGAQKSAVRVEYFSVGRIRYYEAERAAKTPSPTREGVHVTEFNQNTGKVRAWHECYDHRGNVNRVHPKMIDGVLVYGQHYPPTKNELIKFSKK